MRVDTLKGEDAVCFPRDWFEGDGEMRLLSSMVMTRAEVTSDLK